jgi:hypothetical protein
MGNPITGSGLGDASVQGIKKNKKKNKPSNNNTMKNLSS